MMNSIRAFTACTAASVALSCAVTCGLPTLDAQSATNPTAGAAGIGDPYYPGYGNGGYDVAHYTINIDYDPISGKLKGRTTIKATALHGLSSFNLDFLLDATAITVSGQPAAFSRNGQELTITPGQPIPHGTTFEAVVDYTGSPMTLPQTNLVKWTKTDDGGIIGLGEPTSAPWWFPSNDHPRDKATMTTSITVPSDFQAVAAGSLVKNDTNGATSTWTWTEDHPMATYLNFLAVGKYSIKQGMAAGISTFTAISTAGEKEVLDSAQRDLDKTAEVIAWHSKLWGPYPYKTMGGVVPAANVDFSLEAQAKPVYSCIYWEMGDATFLVVHENAHQWFGDLVSVENWKDMWLNEGFASFAEVYWNETHGGQSGDAWLSAMVNKNKPDSPFWKTVISDPGPGKELDISVYKRGASVLQALRRKVGDQVFFAMMRSWVETHQDGNASVAQFRAHAQKVTGQDLKAFFTAWLDTPKRPELTSQNGLDKLPTALAVAPEHDTELILERTYQKLHR